jgi:putative endopeptidase
MLSRCLKFSGVLVFAVTMGWSQTAPAGKTSGSTKPASKTAEPPKTKAPADSVAKEPKFDISNIDPSLDPCTDFYAYSCSKWMKNNPIPADYPEWVSFNEVYEHNLHVLRGILDKAAVNDPKRSPVVQKIGDYYAACMDETAANKAGYAPLKPELGESPRSKTRAK